MLSVNAYNEILKTVSILFFLENLFGMPESYYPINCSKQWKTLRRIEALENLFLISIFCLFWDWRSIWIQMCYIFFCFDVETAVVLHHDHLRNWCRFVLVGFHLKNLEWSTSFVWFTHFFCLLHVFEQIIITIEFSIPSSLTFVSIGLSPSFDVCLKLMFIDMLSSPLCLCCWS